MIRHGLRALASLRLTLTGMLMLVAAVLAAYRGVFDFAWLALPFGLLALNLLAALVTRERLWRSPGLLVFHLGLLAILLGAGAALLVRFEGRAEIVEGQAFAPEQVEVKARGPWHRARLDAVAFVQGPVEVDYAPGLVRRAMRSEVRTGGNGQRILVLGDNRALHAGGYRFVITSNKGLAALLVWSGDDGEVASGAIHFPSYPLHDSSQRNDWVTPRGERLQLALEPTARPPADRAWTLRSAGNDARLVVEGAHGRSVLVGGATLSLDGGRIRFEGVRLWIGYRVEYAPWLPYLFAAAIAGVVGLGWHFGTRSWLRPPQSRFTPATLGVDARG